MFAEPLVKLTNIACQILLFISVSSTMDDQGTLLLRREESQPVLPGLKSNFETSQRNSFQEYLMERQQIIERGLMKV